MKSAGQESATTKEKGRERESEREEERVCLRDNSRFGFAGRQTALGALGVGECSRQSAD